jgi:type II secretory pathway component GspD/PulD (secretin)
LDAPPTYGQTDAPYQVEIEVIVADLATDFTRSLGFVYEFLEEPDDDSEHLRPGDSAIRLYNVSSLTAPLSPSNPFEGLDLQARLASTSYGTFLGRIQAAVGNSRGEILARPRVKTLDAIEAQIKTGQSVPYVSRKATDLSNTILTSDYVDTGVNLTVLPQVIPQLEGPDDDYIKMDVDISVTFVSRYTIDGGQPLPIVATRRATTDVIVRDNHTFGIGGLYRVDYEQVHRSVPYLGDIPYLGYLFTSRANDRLESELVVFVTPRIDRNLEYELHLVSAAAVQEASPEAAP